MCWDNQGETKPGRLQNSTLRNTQQPSVYAPQNAVLAVGKIILLKISPWQLTVKENNHMPLLGGLPWGCPGQWPGRTGGPALRMTSRPPCATNPLLATSEQCFPHLLCGFLCFEMVGLQALIVQAPCSLPSNIWSLYLVSVVLQVDSLLPVLPLLWGSLGPTGMDVKMWKLVEAFGRLPSGSTVVVLSSLLI